jgi:hypothetical protein
MAVPVTVPSRMLVYFARCENPTEYTGRLFWTEREMADISIELDQGFIRSLQAARNGGERPWK